MSASERTFLVRQLFRLGSIYENFIHIVSVKMTDFHLLFGKQLSQINTNSRDTPNCKPTRGNRENAVFHNDNTVGNKQRKEWQMFRVTIRKGGGVSFCDLYLAKLNQKAHTYKHKPGQILALHLCHCKWCNDLKWSSPRHKIHLGPRQWLKELWCG